MLDSMLQSMNDLRVRSMVICRSLCQRYFSSSVNGCGDCGWLLVGVSVGLCLRFLGFPVRFGIGFFFCAVYYYDAKRSCFFSFRFFFFAKMSVGLVRIIMAME